jgi:amino acid permease
MSREEPLNRSAYQEKEEDASPVTRMSATLDLERKDKKIEGVPAFFVLFKSCVGLGVFSYPYAYAKAGIFFGAILSIFMCYITTYGMYRLTTISSEVENSTNGNVRIEDYHFLSYYVTEKAKGKKWANFISTLAIIGTILNNVSLIIASVIEIAVHIQPALGMNIYLVKTGIVVIYLAITAYAIEPEKLKIFGMLSGIVILFIMASMSSDNIRLMLPENKPGPFEYEGWNLANTGIFLGMAGYAYEACGTIFTIRMTMKDRNKMPRLIIYVFSFIGTIFIMFSLGFYFAYGPSQVKSIAFEFYGEHERPMFFYLGVVFCFCLVMFVPMYNISDSELLIHFDSIGNRIKDKDGQINKTKLLFFRWILFILSCLLGFITDKIEIVMNLGGSIVIPIISFYLPVFLNALHHRNQRRKMSTILKVHDAFIFLCGIAITILGVQYSVNDAINKSS